VVKEWRMLDWFAATVRQKPEKGLVQIQGWLRKK